jgi:hypothetical protein
MKEWAQQQSMQLRSLTPAHLELKQTQGQYQAQSHAKHIHPETHASGLCFKS